MAETLRTLLVSPERFIEPGAIVRAMFSFTNVGGGTAREVRVRFALPEGLTYLPGSARIDDEPLEIPTTVGGLVGPEGVDIGEVRSGVQRRITLAYTVASAIENESVIALQAAISSLDMPVIGSNVVRLLVRSRPNLQGQETQLTLTAPHDPLPGAEVQIAVRVRNVGESSANAVMVVMPIPVGTMYVSGSAQIDGVHIDDRQCCEPFGYTDSLMPICALAPGATLAVQYSARIDQALPDGTPIVAHACVSCAEIGEYELTKATLSVSSSASFEDNRTRCEVRLPEAHEELLFDSHEVGVGARLALRLFAHNAGTAAAHGVTAQVELPENTAYMPGSLRVDGQAFPEPVGGMLVPLGEIGVGETRELALLVGITSPAPNGRALGLGVKLRHAGSTRAFTRFLSVRSEPRLSRSRTSMRRVSPPILEPGDTIAHEIVILNDGTTVAEEVILHLRADERMNNLEVYEGKEKYAIQEAGYVCLGSLEAQKPLVISVLGNVDSMVPDGAMLRFSGSVSAKRCESLELDERVTRVRARPRFLSTSSFLRLKSRDHFRPDHLCMLSIGLCNEGNDWARDVSVALRYPPELCLESIEGATRDGSQVIFGDIKPGASREATVCLRLAPVVLRGFIVEVHASIIGRGFVPVVLDTLTLQTHAEPNFSDAFSLLPTPQETVDAGAELSYALVLRNTGDGLAEKLVLKAAPSDAVIYVPGSTLINDRVLPDYAGSSLLWSEQGLVLNAVAPGIDIRIAWRSIVKAPLPTGTLIHATASVACDEAGPHRIEATDVVVHSVPVFSINVGELPFMIAALAPQRMNAESHAPFSSVVDPEMRRMLSLPAKNHVVTGKFAPLHEGSDTRLHLVTEFSQERLDRTFRFLKDTDFCSLFTHLLVLRAFFPGIADGSPQLDTQLESTRAVLRETLDRLFIKTRVPSYEITTEDMEDESSGEKIRQLFASLIHERSAGTVPQRKRIVRIISPINPSQMEALATHIEAAPLGSVVPWYALAHLLGEVLEYDGFQAGHIGAYRDAVIETMSAFIPSPVCMFHHALTAEKFSHLGEALGNVLSSVQEHVDVW